MLQMLSTKDLVRINILQEQENLEKKKGFHITTTA